MYLTTRYVDCFISVTTCAIPNDLVQLFTLSKEFKILKQINDSVLPANKIIFPCVNESLKGQKNVKLSFTQ